LVGALAGALVAVLISERRLQVALAMRPPIMIADYGPFVTALAAGARPEALKVLADQYTSRGGDLGRQGVLVLNGDWVVGSPGRLALPHDRQVLQLTLGTPLGTPLGTVSQPSPLAVHIAGGVPAGSAMPAAQFPGPPFPGTAPGSPGPDAAMRPEVAAALAGAVRAAQPGHGQP
jgi:hypothetical protein